MTSDDIDNLTLREVKAIAERASEVLTALKAVQGLMGAPQQQALPQGPAVTNKGPMVLSAAEQAQRDALMRRDVMEEMPEKIRKAAE